MHECSVHHPALPDLFDPSVPNHPVLWAVLRGRIAGRAFVDNAQNPSQCVLRTAAYLTFSSHEISRAFLDDAIALCRQHGPVWLVWSAAAVHARPPEAAHITQRLEFTGCRSRSRTLKHRRKRLPAGLKIRPIDRALLERCEWRDAMAFYCGSLENFLRNGIGLCLMDGDAILTEAYASSLGEAHAEIGAVTHEAYRGNGYAPIACAFLIERCEQRGFQAYWSCDRDNLASIRVAHKLGFGTKQPYQIYEYNSLASTAIKPGLC